MASDSLLEAGRLDAARAAFRALRPWCVSERAFLASVCEVRMRTETFTHALYTLERRRPVHRIEPAPGTRRTDLSEFTPCMLSAWEADPALLPESSRQLCECVTCEGEKKVACGACAGSGKRLCPACVGGGRETGERGSRQCRSCRGNGTTRCGECKSGKVRCTSCDGVGRVLSWYEVERTTVQRVQADPHELVARWYLQANAVHDFDVRDPAGCIRDEAVPVHRIGELPPALTPRPEPSERPIEARLQTFRFEVYDVVYQTALGRGRVEVSGAPASVRYAEHGPLRWRTRIAAAMALVAVMTCFWAVVQYRAQHAWFAQQPASSAALSLGLLASALLGVFALGALLARPARSRWNTALPGSAALTTAAAAALALLTTQPSMSQARDALTQGDLERASLTAEAVRTTGAPYDPRDPLFDQLRLAQLRAIGDLDGQVRFAAAAGWGDAARAQALAIVSEGVRARAAQARAARDPHALLRLAAMAARLLPDAARPLQLEALDLSLRQCLASDHDLRCAAPLLAELATQGAQELKHQGRTDAIAKTKRLLDHQLAPARRNPREQLAALNLASLHALILRELGAPLVPSDEQHIETQRSRVQEAIEQADRAEQARLGKEREREAREAQRRAEREARKAREQARRAERAEARMFVSRGGGGLLCNDGTLSPSCSCGGSWRGCCSWHGGVAGCE
ncbi:MAG TPA: hypothetical protein VFZ61_18020 [Polyangiales bacterium]